MARKKMTKKANKVTVKGKRKAKKGSLTVAQTLKQLPKQFKKELAVLKKQAAQLVSAIKKAEKQKRKAGIALTKKLTPKKLTAAKKAYNQINQSIANLTLESEAINDATVLLAEKQAIFAELTDAVVKKPKKQKKTSLINKTQKKKTSEKLTLPKQDESTVVDNMAVSEPIDMPSEELEVELND